MKYVLKKAWQLLHPALGVRSLMVHVKNWGRQSQWGCGHRFRQSEIAGWQDK